MLLRVRLLLLAVLATVGLVACSDKEPDGGAALDVAQATGTETAAHSTLTATASTVPGRADGPAEFEGNRAIEHIRVLSVEIGPRVAGSPQDERTVDYVSEQFRQLGYDVEVMDFEYEGDRFRAGLVTAGGAQFEAYTMHGSPGANVRGESVFVGVADPASLAGLDLAGKVAISDRGVVPFGEKLANVQAAGASGLIVINNEPGSFIGNAGTDATIPAVGVDQAAGGELRQAAETGGEVILEATGELSRSKNVIARPDADATCRVLVGGHHDSVPAAPGALDNASGTATTLELARAFAADGLDDGLCFATFGAEESGLFGSKALAERMRGDGTLPSVMVNLDMTGLGDTVDLIGSPELTQIAARVAEGLGIAAAPRELEAFLGSDHQSFQEAGVRVIFLTTNDLGQFHTPGDSIATIDPGDLERAGDLAYALITELAA